MPGIEAKHLFAFAGIDGIDGHGYHATAPAGSAARRRAHSAAAHGRFIGIHRRDHVFVGAIVDLNRSPQIALGNVDLAHIHAAHGHAGLVALARSLNHRRRLRGLPGDRISNRDFEIASDWFFSVGFALRETECANRQLEFHKTAPLIPFAN